MAKNSVEINLLIHAIVTCPRQGHQGNQSAWDEGLDGQALVNDANHKLSRIATFFL